MPIPLGRFLLDDVVGKGGAGLVFRARHLRLDLPVAVKVLPPKADRLALHAHKNEVQAVARLHHPHVVAILDAGTVDIAAAQVAERQGHALAEGSPYLVVELASGGDLHALRPPLAWGDISDILRTLLSALAHAHARGVIHKDLKPQNVLLCTDDDVRPGLKLTDFGLALHGATAERLDGGTPLFMAPEQFDADGRDLGPWTDLYALGCMAHWLATGAPPFVDASWRKLAVKHLTEAPPPLPPSADLPLGFDAWVARLLHKNPALRYRCAADADAALALVDPTRPPPPTNRLPDGLLQLHSDSLADAVADAVDVDAATVMRSPAQDTEILPPRTAPPPESPVQAAARRATRVDSSSSGPSLPSGHSTTQPPLDISAAAMPSSWRTPSAPQPDLRFVDAGLALWGLRPVPLVGREAERDRLWQALVEVHQRRAPRLVALRGPSGVGKSRLAEWVAHRALETGAALVMKATFQPIGSRADGLPAMVARHVGLADKDGPDAKEAAEAWLLRWLPREDISPAELCALAGRGLTAEIVTQVQQRVPLGKDAQRAAARGAPSPSSPSPSSSPPSPASGMHEVHTPEERQAALIRFLAARARERPLLVWLDDVQYSKEALAFAARVLRDAPELPVLFVVTAVDELLDDDARERLDELTREEEKRGESITLEPLDEGAHDELCARLLGGEAGGLADEVRRRTEGNPLFAVHLVGDWVARGLLEVQPGGLALKPGTAPELPDALHALWDKRITTAVGEDGERSRAVELAAVLGSAVDLVEWEAAVQDAALPVAILDEVVDALVKNGLARRSEGGFAFAHALVRGSIERRAREKKRLAGLHASAARALQLLWGTDTPAAAARIGRHLLAAGSATKALQPLLVAARAALEEGDALDAAGLLVDWERARAALKLKDDDARVAPGLVLCAQLAHAEGRHEEARDLAARAASVLKDAKPKASALRIAAAAATAAGDLEDARAKYELAQRVSEAAGDRSGAGASLRGLGDVAYWRGDKAAAVRLYTEANEVFLSTGKKADLAANLWSLGYVEMERGDLDGAKKLFLEQRRLCKAGRDRLGEANAENALGELSRKLGLLDEAEQHYKRATRIAQRSGLSRRWTYRLNMAHLRVLRDDVEGAKQIALELMASPAAMGEPLVSSSCWWVVALDAALRHDLPAWDRAAAQAAELGGKGAIVEDDMVAMAEKAGVAMSYDDGRAEVARAFVRAKKRAR